ncbi:MAG: energy transducer TonB [Acidobacteriota bacterium]
MAALLTRCTLLGLSLAHAYATVDVDRTFALLREGEQLNAAAAAALESKVGRKPNDLENRLRLLSYYAGQQSSSDIDPIRAARARHVLWLIQNAPKASVFDLATRVYALQPTGGPLADPAGWQAARQAWQRQLSAHPQDTPLKRNAATFLEILDPAMVEAILKSTGDDRWLGQLYAKSILGIEATDYKTSDPVSTSDAIRNSDFARHALAELENSPNPALLGGAGFTLNRDGGLLYADGKLTWDYVPLAKRLLEKAGQIDPANQDSFSVVPQLPKRGQRLPITVRLGGALLEKSLRKRVDPVRPAGLQSAGSAVRLNVLVDLDGTVLRAVAVAGPAPLRPAALDAVKKWVFAPTSIQGKPVYVAAILDLLF